MEKMTDQPIYLDEIKITDNALKFTQNYFIDENWERIIEKIFSLDLLVVWNSGKLRNFSIILYI